MVQSTRQATQILDRFSLYLDHLGAPRLISDAAGQQEAALDCAAGDVEKGASRWSMTESAGHGGARGGQRSCQGRCEGLSC